MVEALGVERAEQRAQLAELRIHVSSPDVHGPTARNHPLWMEGDLEVLNKCDLGFDGCQTQAMPTLAKTGVGLSRLVDEIARRLSWIEGIASPTASNERKRRRLHACAAELSYAEDRLGQLGEPELLAEHLRLAVRELERFAGRLDAEEVLDAIFAQFCLGK